MTYVILVTGLSSNSIFFQFIQIGGILTSLFSVARTCCQRHLKWFVDDDRKDPNITTTMKAMLFFAPHVFWRTTAKAFVIAFLKFYSLIPLAVHVLVCSGITAFLHKTQGKDLETSFSDSAINSHTTVQSFFSFVLSLFTPTVYAAKGKFAQSMLRATMLTRAR